MMLLKKPIKEEFKDEKENRQPKSQFITYQQLSKQLQINRQQLGEQLQTNRLLAQLQNNDSYTAYPDSASIQSLTLTDADLKKGQNKYTEYEFDLEKMRQDAKRWEMGIDNEIFKEQDKLIKKLQKENDKLKNENMRLQNENKNLKVKLEKLIVRPDLIVRPYFQLPPEQKYKDKLREYFKLPKYKKLKTANALSSSSQPLNHHR